MMGAVKVAAVQMCSGISPAANIAAMRSLVGTAAARGAQYVQTPEMTGILQKDGEAMLGAIVEQDRDPVFSAASDLARENRIWLHVGSTAIRLSDTMAANRAGLFSPRGDLVATYDKIHMFDVDLGQGENWRESSRYRPGERTVVADTGLFRLGMAICYDIRFPQVFRHQAKLGAEVLTVPAAFTVPTGQAHWETLLRARAIENGAHVIAAAQGGLHEDGRRTYGHSMIISPWGEKIAELAHDEPGVLIAGIDTGQAGEARSRIPNLANERKFSVSVVELEDGAVPQEAAGGRAS